jgi:hypothetical protein
MPVIDDEIVPTFVKTKEESVSRTPRWRFFLG